MGGNDITLGIRLTADGSGMVGTLRLSRAELDKLTDSTRKGGEAAREAAAAQDAQGVSMGRLAQAVTVGNLATKAAEVGMRALGAAIDYVKESALANARFEELGIVMRVVGENAGYTGAQMAQYADETQRMGISMLESRNTVIQLAQAQLSLADSSKLARVAQDVAVIGMTNSSDALQRMIHGIKSGQTDVLRTLGINVDFEASYKRLAASLHTTTEALTEKQKMQARENAVLDEGVKVSGAYEAAMTSAGKQMRSMARYAEDLKVIRGEVFNEALTVAVMAFVDQLKGANESATELAKNGKLKEWGNDVANVLAFVADMAVSVGSTFKIAGASIAFALLAPFAKSPQELAVLREAWSEDVDAATRASSMFRDALEKRRAAHQADVDAAAAIERHRTETMAFYQQQRIAGILSEKQYIETMNAWLLHNYAAASKVADEAPRAGGGNKAHAALMARIEGELALEKSAGDLRLDLLKDQQARGLLSERDYTEAVLAEQLRRLQAQYALAEKEYASAKAPAEREKALAKMRELSVQMAREQAKAEGDLAKAREKALDQGAKTLDALEKEIKALRLHGEEIGLTKDQLARLTDERELAAIAAKEQELSDRTLYETDEAALVILREEIRLMKERRAARASNERRQGIADEAKQMEDEYKRASQEIEKSLTDALMRGFEGGKEFGKNFADTLKNMFKSLVLRPIIQPIAQAGAGAVLSLLGMPAQAGGSWATLNNGMGIGGGSGGGIGNLFSAGGNIVDLFGASGGLNAAGGAGAGLYGAFATSGIGQSLGLSSMLATDFTGFAAPGLTGLGAGIGAALPWIGGALAIGSMLMADDGPGMRTGQAVQWGNGGDNYQYQSAIGAFSPWAHNQWFSGDMGPQQDKFVSSVLALDDALAAAISAADLTAVQSALASDTPDTVNFGLEGEDPSGGFDAFWRERYGIILDALLPGMGKLSTQATLTAEQILHLVSTLSSTRAALQDAGLDTLLTKVADWKPALAGDMLTLLQYAVADPLADATRLAEEQSRTLYGSWQMQGEGLSSLISAFDGSTASAQRLAQAAQARYQTELQLVQQIQQAMQAGSAMFNESIRGIRYGLLDNAGKYQFLDDEASRYDAMMRSVTDPQLIADYAAKLNQTLLAAWNLLDPTQQAAKVDEFEARFAAARDLEQNRLAGTLAQVPAGHSDLPDQIRALGETIDRLVAAAAASDTAAATNLDAANIQLRAAQTPLRVDVQGGGAPRTELAGWTR